MTTREIIERLIVWRAHQDAIVATVGVHGYLEGLVCSQLLEYLEPLNIFGAELDPDWQADFVDEYGPYRKRSIWLASVTNVFKAVGVEIEETFLAKKLLAPMIWVPPWIFARRLTQVKDEIDVITKVAIVYLSHGFRMGRIQNQLRSGMQLQTQTFLFSRLRTTERFSRKMLWGWDFVSVNEHAGVLDHAFVPARWGRVWYQVNVVVRKVFDEMKLPYLGDFFVDSFAMAYIPRWGVGKVAQYTFRDPARFHKYFLYIPGWIEDKGFLATDRNERKGGQNVQVECRVSDPCGEGGGGDQGDAIGYGGDDGEDFEVDGRGGAELPDVGERGDVAECDIFEENREILE